MAVQKQSDKSAQQGSSAQALCAEITAAAAHYGDALESLKSAERQMREAKTASFFRECDFLFRVYPDAGLESYVTYQDAVIEEQPLYFDATELSDINPRYIEFFNRFKDRRLVIGGYKFTIEPVNGQSGQAQSGV